MAAPDAAPEAEDAVLDAGAATAVAVAFVAGAGACETATGASANSPRARKVQDTARVAAGPVAVDAIAAGRRAASDGRSGIRVCGRGRTCTVRDTTGAGAPPPRDGVGRSARSAVRADRYESARID